jgi:peroxiredoxin
MKLTRLAFLGLSAASLFAADAQPGKTQLKVGDMAPDFTLPATNGKQVKLSDFRGKKTVVLAFFPAAFTGGCTKEMTSFASDIDKFTGSDAEVLPISTDNTPTLKHWSEELKASYIMLSDFQRKVTQQYGVLIPDRGIANRTTFVIDKDGKIQHIDEGTAAVDISGAATACSRLKKS